MATHLHGDEQIIINRLLDQSVCGALPESSDSQAISTALSAIKKTAVQQRINHYLKDLLGIAPENYQENLVLLLGAELVEPETVHVLLATLKAVLNIPELQGNQDDRAVATQTIIQRVHSEVVELDEKEIRKLISQLFVERFKLFVPDLPEYTLNDQEQEVEDYWDISPNFNLIAQSMINVFIRQETAVKNRAELTEVQQVNQALLTRRYLSRLEMPQLFATLMAHKKEIATAWAELNRYDLECGDDYALLLDHNRRPSQAKPTVVAIAVAQDIGVGIPERELTDRIKLVAARLLPDFAISTSSVKEALREFSLVTFENEFVSPTPIAQRFAAVVPTTKEREPDAIK
ncbi:hypothetical protein [Lapidilactobacillus gannanensis]|jgi:hypothetical protein|uniref:Uncharacterized protein n=1 Tax=Lapidilactobacillus gannanensis TaxID=2486002 RepID=A0ABW4BNT8_9LACO|nr:hypothetical protein [Lapidilactobacillus gannanensis]MCH4056935.1 hypothetical protein [Lactobacillaceae bacterium]